jgi:phosphomannomutase/phosphoglucomutase
MKLTDSIFRAYDIRGIADTDLTDEVVTVIGHALGSAARDEGATDFGLGRDCRLTGPRLRDAMARGLQQAGLEVVDIGEVPTPLLYFAVHTLGLGGGVQITGSHNPPEYNGLKMMIGRRTLQADAIQDLRRRIEEGRLHRGAGTLRRHDIVPAYLDDVCSRITMGPHRLHVSLDGGNGIAGPTAQALLERLGCTVTGHFLEPDGTFPHHHPDPTTEHSVALLQQHVLDDRSHLAIGYDGDGDRLGVVDDQGQVQWGDRLMILFSRAVLADAPGATILGEVKCSQTLYDDIAARGGVPMMWRTGHSPIKARMQETGALLGGEMSGHIFFAHRWYGFDDALYASARLVEILSHQGPSLHALLADVPTLFATPEIRVDCPDDVKFEVVARASALASRLPGIRDLNTLDGVRIGWPDGWGLVRASNTQPVLVVRTEAATPDRRDALLAVVRDLIRQSMP